MKLIKIKYNIELQTNNKIKYNIELPTYNNNN